MNDYQGPSTVNSTKNGRVVYAWRKPITHFAILFCIYHQTLFFEKKYKNVEEKPRWVKWMGEARLWKKWYWERMCDLKRKEE